MVENIYRIGNFTSSEIFKLIPEGTRPMTDEELVQYKKDNPKSQKKTIADGFSAAGLTYVNEKNLERKLGRSIKTQAYSRDMAWGQFLENRVYDLLEFDYELHSKTTSQHPTIKYWAGSRDLLAPGKKIGEIKCYQPKNFAQYADALMTKDIAFIRENCPEEYWQAVSNSIIESVPNAELILYMPYRSELAEIREAAEYYDEYDQWKYRFIAESPDEDLAFLPDGGYYKNLHSFEFKVPEEDRKRMTDRVILAGKSLIQIPQLDKQPA